MGAFNIGHWAIFLLVVNLMFGTKKLRTLGADLGGAIREFKEGMHQDVATPGQPRPGAYSALI
jgi:sec-independent protein translocase protein TatA